MRRWNQQLALMAGIIGASGCAVVWPERQPVDFPIPDSWVSPAGSTNAPAVAWWETLGGTNLAQIVSEAFRANPNLRATAVRVEQARLRQAIAGADRRPSLDASLEAGKKRSNYIGLPFGDGGVSTSRSESYGFTLSSRWEADVWGRIRAGVFASMMDTAVAQADFAAARQSLAAQTVKAWLALAEAREQIELTRANVGILETTAQQANLRYGLGVGPALDLRLAETNLAAARAALAQWESSLAASQRELETLLGRYPEGGLEGAAALPAMPATVPAGLPSELLTRRPDILGAHHRLMAADARVVEAQADLYPKLSLTTSAGTSSDELEGLLNNNLLVWSLGSNLTQPLLNGERLRNNVKLRESMAAEALANYRNTVLNAFAEVETALANEGLLGVRETQLAEAAIKAAQSHQLAEDRFARGLEPFVRVLDTQRRANEARSQWVAVRRLRLENRVNLHLALAGDFGEVNGVAGFEDSK